MFFQEKVLSLSGFLLFEWNKYRQKEDARAVELLVRLVLFLIPRYLLLGASVLLAFEVGNNIYFYMEPSRSVTSSEPPIVEIVKDLQMCFYPARAILIMTLFLFKAPSLWSRLMRKLQFLLLNKFPEVNRRSAVTKRLRSLSVWLFVVTSSLHVLWSCLEWSRYEYLLPLQANNNTPRMDCYHYFTLCLTFHEFVLMWSPHVDVLFIMSQQVIVSAVLCGVALLYVLSDLNRDIHAAFRDLKPRPLGDIDASSWCELNQKVVTWIATYTQTFEALCLVEALFSGILCVSIGLDVMAVIGTGATLITASDANFSFQAYFVWNTLLFLSYATLFYLPFVYLHEKSIEIGRILRQLIWKVKGHSDPDLNEYTKSSPALRQETTRHLDELAGIVKENVFAVEPGAFFTFTRSFLVRLTTSILTLLLLTREIIERAAHAHNPLLSK
ncbi:hypothetical protein BV898_06212 [Hypsibius exemplaris]|uniref:Gustatory receptor n=1 Tax=Hypsibius exemplaris TaxID=2072580 RepID=A0A1W0WWU3_HYPEX|nr:hypothetical protein BV898_06212 [Hypsibius exemplaris]